MELHKLQIANKLLNTFIALWQDVMSMKWQNEKGRQCKVLLLPFSADDNGQQHHQARDQCHGDPDDCHSVVPQGNCNRNHTAGTSVYLRTTTKKDRRTTLTHKNSNNHHRKDLHEFTSLPIQLTGCFEQLNMCLIAAQFTLKKTTFSEYVLFQSPLTHMTFNLKQKQNISTCILFRYYLHIQIIHYDI